MLTVFLKNIDSVVEINELLVLLTDFKAVTTSDCLWCGRGNGHRVEYFKTFTHSLDKDLDIALEMHKWVDDTEEYYDR